MKIDALEHPKLLDFASRLGVSRPTAIGHLELLWAFTAKMSPAGNLGKYPDGAIARACEWNGEPSLFLQSLLQSRLVDAHPEHRVVVHDWVDHCPRYVKARVKALGQRFVVPVEVAAAGATATTTVDTTVGNTKASLGKARQGMCYDPPTATESTKPPDEWTPAGRIPPTNPGTATGHGSDTYPDETALMRAWALVRASYPARAGREHNWLLGERNWRTLLDDGVGAKVLLDGVDAYAHYVAQGGVSSSAYVLDIANFFGAPDKPWAQEWALPQPIQAKGDEARVAGNIAAAHAWVTGVK